MTTPESANPHVCTITDVWLRDKEDWSGITEMKERRKIQNRRNQRAYRSRKRRERKCPETIPSDREHSTPARTAVTCSVTLLQPIETISELEAFIDAVRSINILDPSSEHTRSIIRQSEAFAYQQYAARTPAVTLLPSLSQFNFIRALFANVEVLGLSSDQMDDDALSPFNSLNVRQSDSSKALILSLPAGLRPTDVQCVIPHHPWIDLLPIPEMRDNIFRRGLDSFDEDALCHALRGIIPGHNPGVLVWRDPWDPNGWEVTESFVKTWAWVIAGCSMLQRSTNNWRAQRGERPLFRLPP